MKKSNFFTQYRLLTNSILVLFLVLILNSCSSVKPLSTASFFRFSMDDESYRIRSVSSTDNENSYNELIGSNFVAVDFDKDRIIDIIMMGEADIIQAQKIYEYGLDLLIQEDKLQVRNSEIVHYLHTNTEYDY